MYFPAEHLLNKLKIFDIELQKFEEKGIVRESQRQDASSTLRETCTASEGFYRS